MSTERMIREGYDQVKMRRSVSEAIWNLESLIWSSSWRLQSSTTPGIFSYVVMSSNAQRTPKCPNPFKSFNQNEIKERKKIAAAVVGYSKLNLDITLSLDFSEPFFRRIEVKKRGGKC